MGIMFGENYDAQRKKVCLYSIWDILASSEQ